MSPSIQNVLAVTGHARVRSGCFHMLNLLRALVARGIGVQLVCDEISPEFAAQQAPFPIHRWADIAGRWPFGDPFAIDRLCARQRAQVVHVHDGGLGHGIEAFLRRCDCPVVYTPYTVSGNFRETHRIQRSAMRAIAVSEYRREALVNRARVPREKLRVVPPGLDLDSYAMHLPQVSERLPAVGAVAPLEEGRGQDIFLQAGKRLLDSGRRLALVVAGDGRMERRLRALTAQLGIGPHVTFVTRLSSYDRTIAALDVFVRPAVTGGLGYTVLEAMAMGKAIVATSIGDIPEMLRESNAGLMVPKGDAAALAQAIESLLDHAERAREMGQAARQRVAERFTLASLAENTLAVYAEAIESFSRMEETA